jgi:PadR family transcriptional regulator, regulatory protein PadR
MGHLYRFVEPVLLLMIKERGQAHGYDLAGDLSSYSFTDAEIERAALYRTLNTLEKNGCVRSEWDTTGSGPARKVYSLTKHGEQHLNEWAQVLTNVSKSMSSFIRKVNALNSGSAKPLRRSPNERPVGA